MNYKAYVQVIRSVFALFGLISILALLTQKFTVPSAAHIASMLEFFSDRIFAIFLFLFAVYAQIKGVKDTRPLEKPIVFILLGALFVIITFGLPLTVFLKTPDMFHDDYTSSQFAEIEAQATDINQTWVWRKTLARKYYLDTGDTILFLDRNNSKSIYSPDDEAVQFRAKRAETKEQFDSARRNGRITAFILIGILVLSMIIFFGVLLYTSKSNLNSSGT